MLITKHYYKASGNINQYVYCPPFPSTHSHVHILFCTWRPFWKLVRAAKTGQSKSPKQETYLRSVPEPGSVTVAQGGIRREIHVLVKLWLNIQHHQWGEGEQNQQQKKKLHFFSVSVQIQKPLVSRQNFSWGFFRNVLLIWDQRRRIMFAVK